MSAKRKTSPRRPARVSPGAMRRQLGPGMLSAFVLVAISIYVLVLSIFR